MISLDPVTRSEHDAQSTTNARALAIRNALVDPVSVTILNASGQPVASGTMTTPWATVNTNVLTIGTVNALTVSASGTPDPLTWRLKFSSGTRWMMGSFGLSSSTADFKWSAATFEIGQVAQFQNTRASIYKSATERDTTDSFDIAPVEVTFGWIPSVIEGVPYQLPSSTQGSDWSYDLRLLTVVPASVTPQFTKIGASPVGVQVATNGLLTKAASVLQGNYDVDVELWDGVPDFGWTLPDLVGVDYTFDTPTSGSNQTNQTATYDVSAFLTVPQGITPSYSITSTPVSGITINPSTGVITKTGVVPVGNYDLTIEAWDGL